MPVLDEGQELPAVEVPRVLEVVARALGERLVALGDGVEEVADGDQLAEVERVPPVDQYLQRHLQRRPFALEERRDRDQGLDEGGTEGIDLAEGVAVGARGQQRLEDLAAHLPRLRVGVVDLPARRLAPRAQQAARGDLGQVAVFQGDALEAGFPPLQHVGEAELQRARHLLAHQLAQVALARHEADDGDGPARRLRLDELRDLRPLLVEEAEVGGVGREPQDELVEEEHQGVVAQVARVPRDHRQPLVEGDERLVASPRHVAVAAEERVDKCGHQPAVLLGPGRRAEGRLEARGVPPRRQVAPAGGGPGGARGGLVHAGEERLVADLLPQPPRVVEEPRAAVDARRGGAGVQLGDARRVASQHRRLEARLADHVIGREEEAPAGEPIAVLRDDAFQTLGGAGLRVLLQQQVEYRHEVALPAAEAAVQISGLARPALDRGLDEMEGPVEGVGELRRHDIGAKRLARLRHAVGEPQDEVVAVHSLGDVDEVAERRHAASGAAAGRSDATRRTAQPTTAAAFTMACSYSAIVVGSCSSPTSGYRPPSL